MARAETLGPLISVIAVSFGEYASAVNGRLSTVQEIAENRMILRKIGLTAQQISRRIADARNDATFLMALVEIVATYELKNLSRSKVESLLHRVFEAARPAELNRDGPDE